MSSDAQPTSTSHLPGGHVDGATPFQYRSSVRTLLGMPDRESPAVFYPMPMTSLELSYAVPHRIADMHVPDQALTDELLRATPDSESWPGLERSPTMAREPEPRAWPGTQPDLAMPSAAAESLSETHVLDQHTIITIPGNTERRLPTSAPEGPAREERPAVPPDHARRSMLSTVDGVEWRESNARNTAEPATTPQTSVGAYQLAEVGRDIVAAPPHRPQPSVVPNLVLPSARTQVTGGVPTPPSSLEVGPAVVSAPTAAARTQPDVGPHTPALARRPEVSPRSAHSIVRQSAGDTEAFRPPDSPVAVSAVIVPALTGHPEVARPIASAPMPVAHARPEVHLAESVYSPARHTVEQIVQLQRTVSELAAQVAAQQAEQQASLQGGPVFPPPAQPVMIVTRSTPQNRTPHAFWERRFLSRLSRWPRR